MLGLIDEDRKLPKGRDFFEMKKEIKRNGGRIKYEQNSIFGNAYFLLALLFFQIKPSYLGNFSLVNATYRYMQFFSLIILLILVAMKATNRIMKQFAWCVVFYGSIFVATFLNDGSMLLACRYYVAYINLVLIFILWGNKNVELLLRCILMFEIYIYINFVTIILFPSGMYTTDLYEANWFLGYKNIQIRFILPMLGFSYIYSFKKYERFSIRSILLSIVSVFSLILINSATGLVGLSTFLGMIIVFCRKQKKLPFFVNLYNGIIAYIAFFVIIVFMNRIDMFAIALNFVGRDVTLTNRVYIWEKVINVLQKYWITGCGYLTEREFVSLIGAVRMTWNHPHNYLLYVAISGGIIGEIALLWGYSVAANALKKEKLSSASKVVLFVLLSYLFMGIAESLTQALLLYPMLILAMNVDKLNIIEQRDAIKKRRRIKIRIN